MSLMLPVALWQSNVSSTLTKTVTTIPLADVDDLTNGAIMGFIIDEGEDSGNEDYGQEYVIGTVDTSGLQLTSCRRGVSVTDGYTEVTANKKKHLRNASIKVATHPYLVRVIRALNGDDQFDADNIMEYDAAPAFTPGSNELATIAYADALAIAGAPDASTTQQGIVEEATQAEVDARTAAGSLARLFVNPATMRAVLMHDYAADAGANDTYAITVTPAPTAYTTGDVYFFKANTVNTGAATLNVNSLGAKTIVKSYNVTLADGDIKANQIVGVIYDGTNFQLLSPVNMDEAQTFFANTDITGAEAQTLTSLGDADSLHTHNSFIQSFLLSLSFSSLNDAIALGSSGFSDAAEDCLAIGIGDTTGNDVYCAKIAFSSLVGSAPYLAARSADTSEDGFTLATELHPLYIGANIWVSNTTSATIRKDGAAVTFSGTARNGPLGHDNTNNYLLVLYSTTKIARFTGISGTTITNANSDITLDTAVTQMGFLYDDLYDRYVCVDTTANILRKFDSAGTTVETSSYGTIADSTVIGVTLIGNRYFLVLQTITGSLAGAAVYIVATTVSLVPTNMTRS